MLSLFNNRNFFAAHERQMDRLFDSFDRAFDFSFPIDHTMDLFFSYPRRRPLVLMDSKEKSKEYNGILSEFEKEY